jgi:ribosome-binding factor A
MTGRRPERLGEQIREEVSQIVLGELKDPRISSAVVTDVEVSPDLRHAKVYVNILGGDEEVRKTLGALRSAAGFVRWQLGQTLRLRYTPQLHFALDKSARAGDRVEEILKEEVGKERGQDLIEESPTTGLSAQTQTDSENGT